MIAVNTTQVTDLPSTTRVGSSTVHDNGDGEPFDRVLERCAGHRRDRSCDRVDPANGDVPGPSSARVAAGDTSDTVDDDATDGVDVMPGVDAGLVPLFGAVTAVPSPTAPQLANPAATDAADVSPVSSAGTLPAAESNGSDSALFQNSAVIPTGSPTDTTPVTVMSEESTPTPDTTSGTGAGIGAKDQSVGVAAPGPRHISDADTPQVTQTGTSTSDTVTGTGGDSDGVAATPAVGGDQSSPADGGDPGDLDGTRSVDDAATGDTSPTLHTGDTSGRSNDRPGAPRTFETAAPSQTTTPPSTRDAFSSIVASTVETVLATSDGDIVVTARNSSGSISVDVSGDGATDADRQTAQDVVDDFNRRQRRDQPPSPHTPTTISADPGVTAVTIVTPTGSTMARLDIRA